MKKVAIFSPTINAGGAEKQACLLAKCLGEQGCSVTFISFYGLEGADTDLDMTIVLNTSNPIIASFPSLDEEKKKFVANQVYYLAMLSYKKLTPEEMKDFSDNMEALLKQYIG